MIRCRCDETSFLRERGLPVPDAHSCAYVQRRNALIPEAARIVKARGLAESAKVGAFMAIMGELSAVEEAQIGYGQGREEVV